MVFLMDVFHTPQELAVKTPDSGLDWDRNSFSLQRFRHFVGLGLGLAAPPDSGTCLGKMLRRPSMQSRTND
jgi:hypothetical protein